MANLPPAIFPAEITDARRIIRVNEIPSFRA